MEPYSLPASMKNYTNQTICHTDETGDTCGILNHGLVLGEIRNCDITTSSDASAYGIQNVAGAHIDEICDVQLSVQSFTQGHPDAPHLSCGILCSTSTIGRISGQIEARGGGFCYAIHTSESSIHFDRDTTLLASGASFGNYAIFSSSPDGLVLSAEGSPTPSITLEGDISAYFGSRCLSFKSGQFVLKGDRCIQASDVTIHSGASLCLQGSSLFKVESLSLCITGADCLPPLIVVSNASISGLERINIKLDGETGAQWRQGAGISLFSPCTAEALERAGISCHLYDERGDLLKAFEELSPLIHDLQIS